MTSAPNYLKWPCILQGEIKVHHVHECMTSVTVSDTSIRFALQLATLEYTVHLKQVYLMNPIALNTTRLKDLNMIYQYPSPKFQALSLYDQQFFQVTANFATIAPIDSQMTLNTTRSNGAHIYFTTGHPDPRVPYFSTFRS